VAYTVLRNSGIFDVSLWELQPYDLVLGTDQRFHPLAAFPELRGLFPQPLLSPQTPTLSDILVGLGTVLVIGIGVCLALAAVAPLFGPQYNDEPLTKSVRNYIRQRDNETCAYCWIQAPSGHVDHRISRVRGGSNDPENLAWACAPCNWSKGTMSDTEFLSLFD
jgi:hypothetical protein